MNEHATRQQCVTPHRRGRDDHARRPLSALLEDCAQGIFAAQRHEGGCSGCAALAERLGLSPASTADTVELLAELGLVRSKPTGGLALTRTGQKVALEVIRHRRVLHAELTHALPENRSHNQQGGSRTCAGSTHTSSR